MPSSTNKRRSGRRTIEREGWFTLAAIERIASCVTADLPASLQNSAAIIDRYFATSTEHGGFGFEGDDFVAGHLAEWYGAPLRLYYFAGLLELAASVGYVDLGVWPDLARFQSALTDFEKREARAFDATDFVLIRDLLKRMDKHEYCANEINRAGFYAFSSYLHLTSAIHRDVRCRSFISSTRTWQLLRNSDLSFLISPRHFAEALATESVAGFPASALINGLACLNYLGWLTEILKRTSYDSTITDKLIRHARWSHHADKVRQRIDIWARRVSEWEINSDSENEVAAAMLKRQSLLPASSDLERLQLQRRPDRTRWMTTKDEMPSAPDVLSKAEELLREGRAGAAKRLLRTAAVGFDDALQQWSRDFVSIITPSVKGLGDSYELISSMIAVCKRLSEIGDIDGAAVLIVKNDDLIALSFGRKSQMTQDAVELVARARRSADSEPAAIPRHADQRAAIPMTLSGSVENATEDRKPLRESEAEE